MRKHLNKRGMAVMDILIILAVLGVVAAITFPLFRTMLHQSREGRTKANLGDIRGAIAIYYSDNYGLFPDDAGTRETRLSRVLVPAYLKEFPAVDLAHYHPNKLNTVHDRLDNGGDWVYATLNGYAYVNSTHVDTKGEPISGW